MTTDSHLFRPVAEVRSPAAGPWSLLFLARADPPAAACSLLFRGRPPLVVLPEEDLRELAMAVGEDPDLPSDAAAAIAHPAYDGDVRPPPEALVRPLLDLVEGRLRVPSSGARVLAAAVAAVWLARGGVPPRARETLDPFVTLCVELASREAARRREVFA